MTWEYLAGFVDGEGHISVRNGAVNGGVRLNIAQAGDVGKCVLLTIREFLLARGITPTQVREIHRRPGHLQCYVLEVTKRAELMKVLKRLLPHLIVKKVVAQDVLRFLVAFPPLRNFGGQGLGVLGAVIGSYNTIRVVPLVR